MKWELDWDWFGDSHETVENTNINMYFQLNKFFSFKIGPLDQLRSDLSECLLQYKLLYIYLFVS